MTRFTVSHHRVERVDWNAEVDGWIRRLVDSRGGHGSHAPYGHAGHDGHHEDHGGHGHR